MISGSDTKVVNLAVGTRPVWLKIGYTLFVAALVPVYWQYYGPQNFLWFSDIALFVTLIAIWVESSLLASMMALAVLLPELAWNAEFFLHLLSGTQGFGLTSYMFDAQIPLWIRALSLFHIVLPVLLIWLVYRLGYDSRAWRAQTFFAWIVFLLSYYLTDPAKNINWVFGPGINPQKTIPPRWYLMAVMVFFPLVLYLPLHLLLKRICSLPRHKA